MNILDIKYCAQDLRFAEEAYKNFERYEQELKAYFLEQPDGYDIFEDLKLRICEMLQSKMKLSGGVISQSDVEEIKKSIGQVKQLEGMVDEDDEPLMPEEEPVKAAPEKKLYRNENETMIAGVCGGLANYFSIDPLAFRLLFVLVAILSKGLGIVSYVIFWVALKSKPLPANLSKRLYRNSADQVIAGVCGGLASFFKTDSWIVRIIFLSPFILNITTQGFLDLGFSIFKGSALGFSIVTYIILWVTTKESETPTEELLARGEDITLNSVSQESERAHVNPDTNSAFNNILRIVAFILIGLALAGAFVFLFSLILGAVFMLPLTGSILHTPLLRWLGGLSVVFFVILPFVGLIVWSIRRLSGTKGPNKTLRTSFGALWGLGFASAIVLAFVMVSEMWGGASVTEKIELPVQGDTLFVDHFAGDSDAFNTKVSYSSAFVNDFYEKDQNEQRARLISFYSKESKDGTFYIEIEKEARGKNKKEATQNASAAEVKHSFSGNTLLLNKYVTLSNKNSYRFQHAKVTFYTPKGKVLEVDPGIKQFKKQNKSFDFSLNGTKMDEETKVEIKQEVEDAMGEVGAAVKEIGDVMEEVGVTLEKVSHEEGSPEDEIKKAEKSTKATIEIEKQKLRIRKEQLRLEKLEQAIKNKKE